VSTVQYGVQTRGVKIFYNVPLTQYDYLPLQYSFICSYQINKENDWKFACNVTLWRVRIPIFAMENATVPHLCTFEQQSFSFVPLASYKTFRTAASIALRDTISHTDC